MIREIMKVTLAQKLLQTTFGEFLTPKVNIAWYACMSSFCYTWLYSKDNKRVTWWYNLFVAANVFGGPVRQAKPPQRQSFHRLRRLTVLLQGRLCYRISGNIHRIPYNVFLYRLYHAYHAISPTIPNHILGFKCNFPTTLEYRMFNCRIFQFWFALTMHGGLDGCFSGSTTRWFSAIVGKINLLQSLFIFPSYCNLFLVAEKWTKTLQIRVTSAWFSCNMFHIIVWVPCRF